MPRLAIVCGLAGVATALAIATPGRGQQPPDFGPKPVFRVAVAGSGHGGVTSTPPGIDCKPRCTAKFLRGSTVVLTATPRAASRFVGWTGACVGRSAWCIQPATSDVSATARFVPGAGGSYDEVATVFVTRPVLNVTTSNVAGVEIESSPAGIRCPPVGKCWSRFDRGTTVTLRASVPKGYRFEGWRGLLVPCTGTGPCRLRMTTTIDVTAAVTRVTP